MRRLTAFLLIILMLAASILPICAETIAYTGNTPTAEVVHEQGGSQNIGADKEEGSFDLEYGVREEFTVTIPAVVEMHLQNTTEVDVSVSNVHLPRAKTLELRVLGQYYPAVTVNNTEYAAGWKIKHSTRDVYLPYSITLPNATVDNNSTIIRYNVGDNTTGGTEEKLSFKVTEPNPTLGGKYQDQLTFYAMIFETN